MTYLIIQAAKYLIVFLILYYTYCCFSIFGYADPEIRKGILTTQTVLMFTIHILAYACMFLATNDVRLFAFCGMQILLFLTILLSYSILYPKVSRLVVNNMCMLLCVGFIMLTRLDYDACVKQFVIAGFAVGCSLVVPVIIRKYRKLADLRNFYSVAGLVSLAIVLVLGRVTGGALLSFTIKGISVQPSELVKIIFVFFVASSFKTSTKFRDVVITTIVAALHVLILVVSKDLGAALIIFVTYLVMLYVATRQPLYVFAGAGAGAGASYVAYYLFSHIRVRVTAWKDPLAAYDNGGYQIAQSLFAIGTGGWFGMGLYQGAPQTIPVATSDCIFAAISEEMGLIFALCLILICLSCYVMFLNIAMQLHSIFYKLVALGLGTCYIFQVFLTIGGETKFIPLTGVTLPLVSYGGSSLLSTIIMFAIIQGLYILREDEEYIIEKKKQEQLRADRLREEVPERVRGRKTTNRPEKKGPEKGRKSTEKKRAGQKQRVR